MYTPLFNRTHYSFQIGYSKVDELVKKCVDYNIGSLPLTDHIMSNSIKLYTECKSTGIKPIYGLIVNSGINLMLYAMNYTGYLELIKLSNKNQVDGLTNNDITSLKNVIVISSDSCSSDLLTLEQELLDRFYVGINILGRPHSSIDRVRSFCKQHGLRSVALNESLFSEKTDRRNHLTLLCSSVRKNYQEIHEGTNNQFIDRVVNNDVFYLHSPEEFAKIGYSPEELARTLEISDRCDNFSVLGTLSFPSFDCDNEPEYLRELCRNGWKSKIANKISPQDQQVYVDRVKRELGVIEKCGLSGYFLIVQEYVNWAKSQGMLVGVGRGSSGGSLISYLTNIVGVDPIRYNLLFERFYNDGRNTVDRISPPDIDTDFPVARRHEVFDHIREKYGKARTCQVATFGSLKGRSALKEIMRIHSICDDKTANEITKNLPMEGSISDKLEEDKEDSVIRWTLNNIPNALKDWCKLENGEYTGTMAETFKEAITMEGTFKSYGKHASALVMSGLVISDNYQMLPDKSSDELLLGVEYADAEKSGLPKMDILGLNCLDKLMNVKSLLRTGKLIC